MSRKKTIKSKGKVKTLIKENVVKLTFLQKIIPPCILSFVTFLFYYPSLRSPFQFDDIANITKKFTIRSDNPLSNWLHHSRWMSDWLNTINYKIGRFDPFYYRFVNICIHILTGILVFYLILDLCSFLKSKSFFIKNALLIAFTTSAIFLLHPVQTQTISYVIQGRLEGLASLFIVTTILLYVKAFKTTNLIFRASLLLFSFLFAFISCGTKEIMIVTPILLILTDWFFISEEKWSKFKTRAIWYIAFLGLFVIAAMLYLDKSMITRALKFQMTSGNNRGNILTHNAYDIITAGHYFISEFKVLLHYLVIFLWPFNISVEYDWKLADGFFAPDAFFPFLALVAIISIGIYCLKKKKHTFVAFGLAWFFITMAPRTSVIPSPELICDYKTYLASIGWIFIISVALVGLFKLIITNIKKIPNFLQIHNYQVILLGLIIALPLGFSSLVRNKVWESPVAFWGDIVVKAPLKARGHNNLGVALAEVNKIDDAIEHYKTAIRLDGHYADPLSNIAVAYSLKNETDKAIAALRNAINIFPNYPEAYNNLGTLLLKKQDYDNAERSLNYAISIRPYYGKAYYNLGRLYVEKKDEEKAWGYFKKATEGDLDTPEGFHTLGQMSLRLKKYKEAIFAFENMLAQGYSNAQILFNLATSYFMSHEFDKSERIYEKLVQDFPLDGRYIYNLAETQFSKTNYKVALELFRKALTLPNPLGQAHIRVALCLSKLEDFTNAKLYLNELLESKAPDTFKQAAKKELAQIELQEKLKDGKGSIRISELQKSFAKIKESEAKEKADKQA